MAAFKANREAIKYRSVKSKRKIKGNYTEIRNIFQSCLRFPFQIGYLSNYSKVKENLRKSKVN